MSFNFHGILLTRYLERVTIQKVPWARGASFKLNPLALGIYQTSYVSIPQEFGNFVLNRTTAIAEKEDAKAIVPFYIMKNYNATKIERVLIVFPGQWRNSWAYINLMSNALNVAKSTLTWASKTIQFCSCHLFSSIRWTVLVAW